MTLFFPNPFSDLVAGRMREIIVEGEFHDLAAALDAQINSQIIPEWYRENSISRIYAILLEMRGQLDNKRDREKVSALLQHMRTKYGGKINIE